MTLRFHRLTSTAILIVFLFSACSPFSAPILKTTAPPGSIGTPPPDLSRYYGEKPPAAELIVADQQQTAGVGTFTWVVKKNGSQVVSQHADAFGLVTPKKLLAVTSPLTVNLKLPIPIAPSALEVGFKPTSADLTFADSNQDFLNWQIPIEHPGTSLPPQVQSEIPFSLEPGQYLLEVYVDWAGLGSVDYGFLLAVQSSSDTAHTLSSLSSPTPPSLSLPSTPLPITPSPSLPVSPSPSLPISSSPTPVPATWTTFTDPSLHLQFRYPAEWRAETPRRLSGPDGFVDLSLQAGPASLFDVTSSICVLTANSNQPTSFGPNPLVSNWAGWDPEHQVWTGHGCLVMPSESPTSAGQAILFTRYPPPLLPDQLLMMRADPIHFQGILSTLQFQDYSLPTPSNGVYNSPACQLASPEPAQTVLQAQSLIITETAIVNANCDPWLHFDGFQALDSYLRDQINLAITYQNGLLQQAEQANLALSPFGYHLVENSPGPWARFDLYQGQTLLLTGLNRLGPVSVNAAGDDFIFWVQNIDRNGPAVEVRRGRTRSLVGLAEQDFNTAWVGADLVEYAYAGGSFLSGGAPTQVNITRNGQLVRTLSSVPPGADGFPVSGFWSWNDHWLLEMDGVVFQDGQGLNEILQADELFAWHLVAGQPFYFFQKGSSYGLSYAGQDLPLHYDDIIHGRLCCDKAHYSIVGTPGGTLFYARRGNMWYLVQVTTK